jgi:hypothetical protein
MLINDLLRNYTVIPFCKPATGADYPHGDYVVHANSMDTARIQAKRLMNTGDFSIIRIYPPMADSAITVESNPS